MKLDEQQKAVALRKRGYSMREISERLHVSKSSVSLWVRSVPLSPQALKRLDGIYTAGQIASQETHRKITAKKTDDAEHYAREIVDSLQDNLAGDQILCSLLYWCEGSKLYGNRGCFSFTNSDPMLVSAFLRLFRKSFPVDESKFSVCVHIHGYHDEKTQLKFWSKTTNIPMKQFIRSYRKKESRQTIRQGYQGCIQVRYYDNKLFRNILAIAQTYMLRARGL